MTRTHVVYFTREELAPLLLAIGKVIESIDERRPHISEEAARAMDRRIDIVRSAANLLLEPVPGPFE